MPLFVWASAPTRMRLDVVMLLLLEGPDLLDIAPTYVGS
jgi:hypothetical protein